MLLQNSNSQTKASTLINLQEKLEKAKILPCYAFSLKDWCNNSQFYIDHIVSNMPNIDLFIVRSSTQREDQIDESLAGKFNSVLNVKTAKLREAIDKVINSYGKQRANDEILVQPMLQDVTMSGVVFTYDPNTASPYYIINYDLKGDTTAITAGKSVGYTAYVSRNIKKITSDYFARLINLARELEYLLNNQKLDIEFAFNYQSELYLFQVRPLVMKNGDKANNYDKILQNIKYKVKQANLKHPYLFGRKTILGVMPDWNPAEIIGLRPKPLALSLYKEIITDSTWAHQRNNYGYKNLCGFPLLIDLCGMPYIDARVSFNSFIPKKLNASIADKLVNYYLERLESFPYLHDKVEFDIVFSCYTFDLPERIKILKHHKFDDSEIECIINSLKDLTNAIVHKSKGLWLKDIEKIKELQKRHALILSNENFDELTKIYWLVEDCRCYGTLPFAGLARAGFMAIQLLNSMVTSGVLTSEEKLSFLNNLDSVSSRLTKDLHKLSKGEFLAKYGHLRPGTYDVLSPRYDEAPNVYFDWSKPDGYQNNQCPEFRLTLTQLRKIGDLLNHHGLDHDVFDPFNFMKSAIEAREYSKFIFTKTLSDVLSLIKTLTLKYEFNLEDASFIDLKKLIGLYSTSWNLFDELKEMIDEGKRKHQITSMLNLPPLIFKEEDVEYFELPENKPNFITLKNITAPTVKGLSDTNKLKGSIVFIPSADPGYDWIFTRSISGFITTYGGVNSHMAIRAGELGLPAVIGAGERLYNQWVQAKTIHLDCANHRVEIIQ